MSVRLFAGDWNSLSTVPSSFDVDLLLASETTYTEGSCRETATLIARHLRAGRRRKGGRSGEEEEEAEKEEEDGPEGEGEGGVALVSMKRFYFGVGGGVGSFRKALEEVNTRERSEGRRDGRMYKELREVGNVLYDNGRGNIREIIKIVALIHDVDAL